MGQGPRRILIDTGAGKPVWIETLKKVLASEKATVEQVLLTHWHPDHVGGVEDLRLLSPTTKFFKNEANEGQFEIQHGQKFETLGASLQSFHCPGHTTDHMVFVLEEEEGEAMFTGDNVLGHGTAVYEDLPTYMKSLGQMAGQFSGRAYPGHGAIIEDGKERVLEYIRHRREREDQVLHVLESDPEPGSSGVAGWQSTAIVEAIYKDVPVELHPAAERGVLQILQKLLTEGKVVQELQNTWKSSKKAAL